MKLNEATRNLIHYRVEKIKAFLSNINEIKREDDARAVIRVREEHRAELQQLTESLRLNLEEDPKDQEEKGHIWT